MTTTTAGRAGVTPRSRSRLYDVLIGLTGLLVLLQGLWAGIFLEHDGARDDASTWIDVHARGAETALGLAAIAFLVALVRARDRYDLLIGTAVLVALLLVEAYLGGLVRDAGQDTLTAVHVPLAMAIMGLAVWLPLHDRRRRHR